MVVRIRLARHGQRHTPVYHVVAINASKRRDARPLEKLGEYDPIPRTPAAFAALPPKANVFGPQKFEVPKEKRIEWNVERINYWLSVGAEPTRSVVKLLERVSRGERLQMEATTTDSPLTGRRPHHSSQVAAPLVARSPRHRAWYRCG